MTEREVVALVKEWKDEMKGVIADYNAMLAKLDTAVTIAKDSEKKWWVVYKTHITVVIAVIGVLLFIWFAGFIMKSNNLCIVNVGANDKSVDIQSCKLEASNEAKVE